MRALFSFLCTRSALPSPLMPSFIELRNVTKSYRTLQEEDLLALQDVSFEVGKSEFVSVVGASGCGKTTLLKIIAGLIPHSSGEVRIGGSSVKGPRKDIGFVFQQPVLLPWRTVLENTLLPIEVMGLPREEYGKRALDILDRVGLSGFSDKYPFELSGGMQQRVAITRALVYDPDVLLLDEPFGALDAMTRESLNLELLRIWSDHRKTVLFVTHSISEAIFLSDRVVALTPRPGRLADVVEVDLPRPRRLDVIQTEAFGMLAKRIRSLLGIGEEVGGIE
ncbi:MAG: ABC transporter ATP-binding protein [Acidobacteriota bacterium]